MRHKIRYLEQSHEEEELQDGEDGNVNVDLHLEGFVGSGHVLPPHQRRQKKRVRRDRHHLMQINKNQNILLATNAKPHIVAK
jgi:hypothetical protein